MNSRPGVVLLFALLCIVALELTAVGLHFTAAQQLRIARSGSRALQLRVSAQSAIVSALSGLPPEQVLALPVGGAMPVPEAAGRVPGRGIEYGVVVERLDSALFLLRAEAVSPLGERARAGYLVVITDPASTLGEAALTATADVTLAAGARLTASSGGCPDAGTPPLALRAAAADQLEIAAGAEVVGGTEFLGGLSGAPLESLTPFTMEEVQTAATELTSNRLSPQPASSGSRCVTELVTNWGEPVPAGPDDPCARWFPVLAMPGNLTLEGGRGQGLLYVAGDLALTGGATFSGLVLVGGRLSLADGAAIRGAAIVTGPVAILDGQVAADRCALDSALRAAPALSGPFRPGSRSWIPLF